MNNEGKRGQQRRCGSGRSAAACCKPGNAAAAWAPSQRDAGGRIRWCPQSPNSQTDHSGGATRFNETYTAAAVRCSLASLVLHRASVAQAHEQARVAPNRLDKLVVTGSNIKWPDEALDPLPRAAA